MAVQERGHDRLVRRSGHLVRALVDSGPKVAEAADFACTPDQAPERFEGQYLRRTAGSLPGTDTSSQPRVRHRMTAPDVADLAAQNEPERQLVFGPWLYGVDTRRPGHQAVILHSARHGVQDAQGGSSRSPPGWPP